MLKVLILDRCWKQAPELYAAHGIDVLDPAHETADVRIDFVILRSSSSLDAARLAALRSRGLRVVLRAGTGLDNIDTEYCASNGIDVVNFPGRNAESVAEVTLSFMISGVHRLYAANREMQCGVFAKERFLGRDLRGASVGFVGYGATARATTALLRSLGLEDIRAYRRPSRAEDPHAVRFVDLEECFQADIVSLNVPLSQSTRYMVDDRLLSCAKSGLLLVNVARRDIVDHAALAMHLDRGHVAGYASDVLDPQKDAALIHRPEVFATPHLGAQSVDCQRIIAYAILDYMTSCKVTTV